ncbi:hypothetical protein FACS189427_12410 [Planctomycetales bacterium]|nr:hypothetical protein FACS189427_12410 [Planctomycetales bacterium]
MSRLTDEQIKKITAQVISCCCKEPVTTPLVQCCGGTFFVRNRYDEWAYLDGQEFTPAQNAPCSVSLSNYAPSQYPCVDLYEWLDGDLYYKEANCLGTINLTKIASGGTAPNLNRFSSKSRYYLWTADY